MKTNTMTKQPKVFLLSVLLAGCERFGFYILADSLILYLEHVFGFADHNANIFYSTLNALVYSAPAIGGYIADNYLGIRRAMALGLVLEGLGQFCLIFSGQMFLYLGIALVIAGVGFFKTSPTNLMARAYQPKDPRIDSGYTLFYMVINMGSAISAILAGFLQRYFGWHIIFLIAGIGTYLGLIVYYVFRHRAQSVDVIAGNNKLTLLKIAVIFFGLLIGITAIAALMYAPLIARGVFYAVAAALVIYFLYEIYRSEMAEKRKIIACLLLILMGMIFFMMYYQRYTSVLLFMDRSVRHSLFGYTIPSIAMLALNPLWIITLSPLLVLTYNQLARKRKDLAITTKFALGLLITSLSFFVLKFSTYFVDANQQISWVWMVISFGLYSLGELLISALGVAMVARLAPQRMYGVMMGAWFLIATSIGSLLGGFAANLADIPKDLTDPVLILQVYGHTFLEIGMVGLLITLLAFIAGPYVKKIAGLR
jgi:POT family proton-dependent oligopeptide transporter